MPSERPRDNGARKAPSADDARERRRREAQRRVNERYADLDLAARAAGNADFARTHDYRSPDERARAERPLYADTPAPADAAPADGQEQRTSDGRLSNPSLHRVHMDGVQFGSENAYSTSEIDAKKAGTSPLGPLVQSPQPQRRRRTRPGEGWSSRTSSSWTAQGPNTGHRWGEQSRQRHVLALAIVIIVVAVVAILALVHGCSA
ncbi:MAG: hypothetical protein SOI38_07465 [Eggerthellaceae bacterium]|jgi:hypothetical protein